MPEIEHLRSTLEPGLIGALIQRARLHREDVLRGQGGSRVGASLLVGRRVAGLHRHGKQLAIEADSGAVLCVHLGMTGSLRLLGRRERLSHLRHVHCVWWLRDCPASRMIFRDPRRFGGLWSFLNLNTLRSARWSQLGPDALTISDIDLIAALRRTRQPIKAALLDQRLLAGVGNIYADESLFRARVHPARVARSLSARTVIRLNDCLRTVLHEAINHGGSTVRDYVDSLGNSGRFADLHAVYGRDGQPCLVCDRTLRLIRIAGRSTVFCPRCQRCA